MHRVGAWATGLVVATLTCPAAAQLEPLREGLSVGEWTFYPSLELRVRGEYRRHPAEIGTQTYVSRSPQNEAFQSELPLPAVGSAEPVDDNYVISERARLGLKVAYDVLSAKLTLQDTRTLGLPAPSTGVNNTNFGEFAPWEAWLDVRTSVEDPWLWVRVGRQPIRWGDGRLVGDNDWSPRGNTYDAVRAHFEFSDVDIELLGALLAVPGLTTGQYPAAGDTAPGALGGLSPVQDGSGAQLYGFDLKWPIVPLFGLEATMLARVVRDPVPVELARGDTFTADLRLFGQERGLRYAVEGAYQFGRVAGYGFNWDVSAFAVAAMADWRTSLPGDLRIGIHGAYASGQDDGGQQPDQTSRTLKRFDPISPTTHEHHGVMDLYAWSNVIDGGLDIGTQPVELLDLALGYTFVGLAEPNGRWMTANLITVGAAPLNESQILGHEIDATITVQPWEAFGVGMGYGAFILGDGGKAIYANSGRGEADLLHYAYLQAELIAP